MRACSKELPSIIGVLMAAGADANAVDEVRNIFLYF